MDKNIKAVVLDIDGILIGHKGGPNFPEPCLKIINALKSIKDAGLPVILCTGRPFYTPAMAAIIDAAGLDNFNIGDIGSLIINPLSQKILWMSSIDCANALELTAALVKAGIHANIFTPERYLTQKNQIDPDIDTALGHSVGVAPVGVDSLAEAIFESPVLYLSGISIRPDAKSAIEDIAARYSGKIELLWGNNLWLPGYWYGNFTPLGVSKSKSLKFLIDHLGISFANVLGAGDGIVDWDFMKFCGYRATLENALPEVLKNMHEARDPARNFIGPSVDQNGILDAFRHFSLIIKEKKLKNF